MCYVVNDNINLTGNVANVNIEAREN